MPFQRGGTRWNCRSVPAALLVLQRMFTLTAPSLDHRSLAQLLVHPLIVSRAMQRCTAPTAASASTGLRAAPSPSARTPRLQQSRRSCTSTGQTGACPPPSRPSARGDRTASAPFISFQIHPPDLQDAATNSACLA